MRGGSKPTNPIVIANMLLFKKRDNSIIKL